jgi:hypothetical protein
VVKASTLSVVGSGFDSRSPLRLFVWENKTIRLDCTPGSRASGRSQDRTPGTPSTGRLVALSSLRVGKAAQITGRSTSCKVDWAVAHKTESVRREFSRAAVGGADNKALLKVCYEERFN